MSQKLAWPVSLPLYFMYEKYAAENGCWGVLFCFWPFVLLRCHDIWPVVVNGDGDC